MPARLAKLRAAAEPFAAGYTLLRWVGVTPTEHLAQVAIVHGAMADAPRDDGMEPAAWTAERVRQPEQAMIDHRLTIYSVAARHDATGDLAALTQVLTEADTPDWAFQQVTAVLSEHRGHRLGLLVKIGMLDLVTAHDTAVALSDRQRRSERAHDRDQRATGLYGQRRQPGLGTCPIRRSFRWPYEQRMTGV